MSYRSEMPAAVRERIRKLLEILQVDQERHPLAAAEEFGYLLYVRLFTESQKRESLKPYFPYAGFPMEWPREEEQTDDQLQWQLQYEMQYCASIVEEGQFMEQARMPEQAVRSREFCRLIDELAAVCDWEQGMPAVFGGALAEMVEQIYDLGTSDLFLLPDCLTDLLIQLAGEREDCSVWNPGCSTGVFLASCYRQHPRWHLTGSEKHPEVYRLATMLQFYHGAGKNQIRKEDPLTSDPDQLYDLIVANPPVGELTMAEQDRFAIPTRKIQLQYLQMAMERLAPEGMALMLVNEGALFMFDAEKKVRQKLVETYQLLGVISIPAGAFLPYTVSKASVLIFSRQPRPTEWIWFYQLQHLGYTLDRKREAVEANDLPDLLQAWKQKEDLVEAWKKALEEGSRKNQWENPVPMAWEQKNCWFAHRDAVRANDYNLTVGRYRPEEVRDLQERPDPMVILQDLERMEEETGRQLQELIAMVKRYDE